MNPSGMLMIPGLASEYQDNAPPSESGPGHTVGLITTSAMELITPNSTPVTAPAVLNRRHVSASSSEIGRASCRERVEVPEGAGSIGGRRSGRHERGVGGG